MLHQKYIVEKATLAQIAKEFSCSKNAVRGALMRADIPIRGRSESGVSSTKYGVRRFKGRRIEDQAEQKVIVAIIEMRDDGMSYDKIANFLTKMGVPTKTRRRKWKGGSVRSIYLHNKV